MANDELYTPKHIFDALQLIFDLDVCAPKGGALHTPAVEYFDKDSDGLTAKWFGTVWMNPPFSNASPWVKKWKEHANGVALLPLAGNTRWWRDLWQSGASVIMLEPNTEFIKPNGEKHRIWLGVSLWALGDAATKALIDSGLGRVR